MAQMMLHGDSDDDDDDDDDDTETASEDDVEELRKLVRKVQLVHEQRKDVTPEKQKEVDAALMTAEKSLNRFLHSMVKQMESEQSSL